MRVQSTEEFFEEVERMNFLTGLPWDRFFINQARKREGRPPLTLRECRAWERRFMARN